MERDVIIALDFSSAEEVFSFLHRLEHKAFVKVGMELFYKEGPSIVTRLKEEGYKIFLDLKLHDIPNTVRHGMKSIASLGADMVDVHIAGGAAMIQGVREELDSLEHPPLLLGITQLTSTSEAQMHEELLLQEDLSLEDVVSAYAQLGVDAGLDGIVCSPLEVPRLREISKDIVTVTPGIRLKEAKEDDQTRIVTPEKARELGSTFIVVGRPITKAEDPKKAYETICKAFKEGV